MLKIYEYDALTDENVEFVVTPEELESRFGSDETKTFGEIVEEQNAAKNAAKQKLVLLGLTEEDLIALGF